MNALYTNDFHYLSAQPDNCSTSSLYSLLICCHPFSATYILFSKNHQSRILLCITSSLESTSCLIPPALHKHPADDVTLSNSPLICSPLSTSITHPLFHSRLKAHLFQKSFPPYSASTHLDCLLGLHLTGLFLLSSCYYSFVLSRLVRYLSASFGAGVNTGSSHTITATNL